MQPTRKLIWADAHASQHPFNDVAVVAQKSTGFAGVMAMIGPNLSSIKVSAAYSALVVLYLQKFCNVCIGHSSASFSLLRQALVVAFCVSFTQSDKFFRSGFGFFGFRMFPSSSFGLRAGVDKAPAFLDLWPCTVLAAPLAFALKVCKSVGAVVLEIFGPLFLCVFGFAIGFHTTLKILRSINLLRSI